MKDSSTYNANNMQTERLHQTWDGSAWVNNNKFLFTYDENNNLTEDLFQYWHDPAWVNLHKYSSTYDANNNQTEFLYQNWDDSVWINSYMYLYTYNENNKLTETIHKTWEVSAWVNFIRTLFISYGNNNLIEILGYIWDDSVWVNYIRDLYIYIPVTTVNENLIFVNSYNLSNNYPNPFNSSTKINYSIPERSIVSLKVFDLLGREVVEIVKGEIEAGTYDINFSPPNLPSGVYFYQLQAGSFLQTKKMILLK